MALARVWASTSNLQPQPPMSRRRILRLRFRRRVVGCTTAGLVPASLGLQPQSDGVRVQNEIHSRNGLTKSSGILGGSQSVVNRIESSHALSFCMERRAVALRRDLRGGFFKEVPFGWRAVSQPNSSRAWLADSFLTFFTASSTALMPDTLAGKSVWSKQVLCPSPAL